MMTKNIFLRRTLVAGAACLTLGTSGAQEAAPAQQPTNVPTVPVASAPSAGVVASNVQQGTPTNTPTVVAPQPQDTRNDSAPVTEVPVQTAPLPTQSTSQEARLPVAEAPIAVPPAPRSNLGKSEEEWVEVVIPGAQEVLDDFVDDLRGLQISPQQARRLKEINLERGRQRVTPYLDVPAVTTRSVAVNLAPGSKPPEINLARGFQTSLVFMDAGGNPWAIEHIQMNRQMFSDGGNVMAGSVLSIEPQTAIAYGNVTIRLKGKTTPVVLMLNAGGNASAGRSVDVRVDVKIPGRSPDAPMGRVIETVASPDDSMLNFLDGNAPADAIRMQASGGVWMDAWRWRGNLYVRTKDVVMWPAYDAASRSGTDDGVYVYRFREDVDNDEVLGKDSFALTFRHGTYGDVRTVFFSPRVQRAIVGEDVDSAAQRKDKGSM
ncbi:MAG: hypothetical protein IKZ87_00800 [Actinomycetaceae bacterium]|nr:hypothetical protein [Actinomycetaceae bacterium]